MAKEPDRLTRWARSNRAASLAVTILLVVAGMALIFIQELTRPAGRSGPMWLTIAGPLIMCSGFALRQLRKVPSSSDQG